MARGKRDTKDREIVEVFNVRTNAERKMYKDTLLNKGEDWMIKEEPKPIKAKKAEKTTKE